MTRIGHVADLADADALKMRVNRIRPGGGEVCGAVHGDLANVLWRLLHAERKNQVAATVSAATASLRDVQQKTRRRCPNQPETSRRSRFRKRAIRDRRRQPFVRLWQAISPRAHSQACRAPT